MAIRTRMTDGYQQVELTSELLRGSSGATQQVISTVPCTKHLPFFLSILLADLFLFGSVIVFAIYSAQYGDGFSLDRQPDAPYRQFNLHALIMITALIYLNGQAIMVYKSNYLVKHKSINMLYHFMLHLWTIVGILTGLYMTYNAQEALQSARPKVSHLYSVHSWTGLVAIGLFTIQFLFGFFSFFVTLCCRKLTARMRAKALPIHRMLAMIVLCSSVAAVISGLSQLARFELNGQGGNSEYRDLGIPTILINVTGMCVLVSTVLIFFVTFIFKRRQAHDLPAVFKIILLITQFVELILILAVVEFILQVVTPHVNKVINGEIMSNVTLSHIFNNATQSIHTFINTAKQHITNTINGQQVNVSSTQAPETSNNSILLGSSTTR